MTDYKRDHEIKGSDNLSEAASKMKSKDSTPEERSEAASKMGKKGGEHSHSGTGPQHPSEKDEDEDEEKKN